MAIEVLVLGKDGFGGTVWNIRAPWLDPGDMFKVLDLDQEDALTWRARITRAECYAILEDAKPPLPWHEDRAAELRKRLWSPETREVEILLAEW